MHTDKAPVDFTEQRNIQRVEHGHNRVSACDGLRHAKDRSVGLERGWAEAVEEQLIERDGLRIEIEKRIGMHSELRLGRRTGGRGNYGDLFNRRVNGLVIEACAPGAVICGDGVRVPACSPKFIGREVANISAACAESILRGEAAHGDMQRMIGEEKLRASRDSLEREVLAALLEACGLAAEVGVDFALLCAHSAPIKSQQRDDDWQSSQLSS